PALGLSLLKAELFELGIKADIRYFNLLWAQHLSENFVGEVGSFTEIADRFPHGVIDLLLQVGQNFSMVDEWIFARHLFGSDCPDVKGFVETLLPKEYSQEEIDVFLAMCDLVAPFLDDCL